jgi:hypothetical protein
LCYSYRIQHKDTDVIELSNVVSGSGGFVINGDKLEDFSGYSVSSAGDVNGDGLSDLIVGTFAASINGIGTYEGKSYVVFGKNNTNGIGRAKHNERFTRLHLSVRACFISSNNQII